jgi:hypothetical protein
MREPAEYLWFGIALGVILWALYHGMDYARFLHPMVR